MTTQPTEATMTDAELDALVALGEGAFEALVEQASQARWNRAHQWFHQNGGDTVPWNCITDEEQSVERDALRRDLEAAGVPNLIAALTTLRKQRDELREALESVAEWQDAALGHHSCALDMRTTARRALSNMEGE